MLPGPAWQTSTEQEGKALQQGAGGCDGNFSRPVMASYGQLRTSETPVTQRPLEANHEISSIFPYLGSRI